MPVVDKNVQKKIKVPVLAVKTRCFLPEKLIFILFLSYFLGTAGPKIKKIMPSLVPSLVPVACGRVFGHRTLVHALFSHSQISPLRSVHSRGFLYRHGLKMPPRHRLRRGRSGWKRNADCQRCHGMKPYLGRSRPRLSQYITGTINIGEKTTHGFPSTRAYRGR